MPAIVSRHVVLGGGAEPLRVGPALVEWEGTRITRVVEPAGASGGFDDLVDRLVARGEARDLGDEWVSPAFVNAHTHLALVFLRGVDARTFAGVGGADNLVEKLYFRLERSLEPGDVRAFARLGAYESLLGGVGFVWDHYYFANEVAEALVDVGLAGAVAPTLQDRGGPFPEAWEQGLALAVELAKSARLAAHGVVSALGPHATDTVSDELWNRTLDVAEREGLPVHAHVAQSLDEYARSLATRGVSPLRGLERLGVLARAPSLVLAHGVFASYAELARLHPERHGLVFCPASSYRFAFPSDVMAWSRAGARWAIATDCAASNDSMDVQKELRLLAGVRAHAATWSPAYRRFIDDGRAADVTEAWRVRADAYDEFEPEASPARLLARVWGIPGAFHPAVRTGALEPGALASFAAWDPTHPSVWPGLAPLHSLAWTQPSPAMVELVVAGRGVGVRGDVAQSLVRSAEYREAVREADARLAKLASRAGFPAPPARRTAAKA